MPAVIVVGDRTSHGGMVISGAPTSDTHGKPIARVGDSVTCPLKGHGGVTVIVSGDPTLIIDGQPVARHGDRTACGAVLLASQQVTTDDPGSGRTVSGSSSDSNSLGSDHGLRHPAERRYDLHFHVLDESSGHPLADTPYRIELETGEEVFGRTDAQGYTEYVSSDSPVTATLEAPWYDSCSSPSDAGHGSPACGC